MKTYSSRFRVEGLHIDSGNHANWRSQLAVAEDIHFTFREQYGLGLDELRERYKLFLVIRTFKNAIYRKQLRLGDIIDVSITMWIPRPAVIQFDFLFRKDEAVATEMTWLMSFVSTETDRPSRIPQWVVDAIGVEIPSNYLLARTA